MVFVLCIVCVQLRFQQTTVCSAVLKLLCVDRMWLHCVHRFAMEATMSHIAIQGLQFIFLPDLLYVFR